MFRLSVFSECVSKSVLKFQSSVLSVNVRFVSVLTQPWF